MNLLIVDDEVSSIRAVSQMLSWQDLGIDRVLTARSAQEARTCILETPIDILLCDIEMPQESGLDLLEWINRQQLDICCILMTCYAEFSYAQRAVKLGSLAYLLKPIDPQELEREIRAAISRKEEMARMRSTQQLWDENAEKTCQQFLRDLFYEEVPSDPAVIRREIARLSLPLDPDGCYCPVLLSVRRWGEDPSREEEDAAYGRYAVHNVASELLERETRSSRCWHTVIRFGKNDLLILCGGSDPQQLRSLSRTFAQAYQQAEQNCLHSQTVCYVGRAQPLVQLSAEIEALLHLDSNHLQNRGLVMHEAQEAPLPAESDLTGRFERWTALLEGEQFARVRREIGDYLSRQARRPGFNRRRFIYFLNSYAGMLVGYAERHHFPLNRLTAEPANADCFERSDQSPEEMLAWVECSLTQLEQGNARFSQDPVTATRAFIEDHLSEELDVSQIAENVHLNQDYLTRIFKRETGVSVKSYVVSRRMEKARNLLQTTRLPITDVACQVGYSNYTSFNRVFKKTFRMSPQSFRKQAD